MKSFGGQFGVSTIYGLKNHKFIDLRQNRPFLPLKEEHKDIRIENL